MSFLFFGKKRQNDDVYKSRLEHKLYLARENPEPVFDLSDCNLKDVPSGIYSLCKVFRKKKLSLQVNRLSSLSGGGQLGDLYLLTVVELQNNQLTELPDDISLLINLQVLNVSHNYLHQLPETVGRLRDLQLLNCSHNRLRSLPFAIGEMVGLTQLDLRDNPQLHELPPSLAGATALQELLVDPDTVLSPPSLVTSQGATAVLQFLSRENDKSIVPKSKVSPVESKCGEQNIQSEVSFKLLEKKKKCKLQELREFEQMLQEQKIREFELHESNKQDKSKFVSRLLEQEKKMEKDITRVHEEKEQERVRLLHYLLKVERQVDEVISDLLAMSQAVHSISGERLAQDLQEQQLLTDFKANAAELQRKRVTDAMELLLSGEYARKEKYLAYQKSRAQIVQDSLTREVEWRQQVCELVQERDTRQSEMLSAVHRDTQVQRALVARLLERSDLRTQNLLVQTILVQEQLVALTAAELQSRHQNSAYHMNMLSEKRHRLTEMLEDLLKQQDERRRQLLDTIHRLEDSCKMQMGESTSDYWLRHYQYLMDHRPPPTTTVLDPTLVHQLVAAGVTHCLPYLTFCSLHSLSQDLLYQVGVKEEQDRVKILTVVGTYMRQLEIKEAPSAPPEELYEPSAPPTPFQSALPECVVCMELQCMVVFMPCGHLCACTSCASQLILCPLCRSPLDRKVHIIVP